MRQNVSKKRGGFTLIEVILAIVVVAVIMGIVIPKVMSNSDKAQIKQSISSDVRSIVEAAADWKRTDKSTSDGTYKNIKAEELDSRLPSNMELNTDSKKKIKSSGFNGGCVYGLKSSTINTDGDSFELAMDCEKAKGNLNWSTKLIAYAKQAFYDTVKSLGGSDTDKEESDTDVDGIDCSQTTKAIKCAYRISQ